MAGRLSSEKIKNIIRLYEKGLSMRGIAEKLGVSVGVVHKYIDRYRRGLLSLEELESSRASPAEVMDDLKYMMKLRTMKEDKRLPILLKELEIQSWWHKVVHDVGAAAVLLALADAEIPYSELAEKVEEWKRDPSKLEEYVMKWVDRSIACWICSNKKIEPS